MYKKICILLVISALVVGGNTLNGRFAYQHPKKNEIIYIVKPGDTLWSIAAKYCDNNTDIMEEIHKIKMQNQIDGHLYIGQKLIIEAK